MSCPNCKDFHKVCKAGCCGLIPIPQKTLADNFHLIQRPIKETQSFGTDVLVITEDLSCPFLSQDYACMIYESRPEVCKKYGDASHILMTCAFQKPDGNARNRKEHKQIERLQSKETNKMYNRWA